MSTLTSRRAVISIVAATPLAPVSALAAIRPVERAEHRARLLAAYAEDRACYPILGEAPHDSLQDRAITHVNIKAWDMEQKVLALPPPATLDGLGLAAMAAAMAWEGESPADHMEHAAVNLIRAVLTYTGTVMPNGWTGFGDDPDHDARVASANARTAVIPSWAWAAAEVQPCA